MAVTDQHAPPPGAPRIETEPPFATSDLSFAYGRRSRHAVESVTLQFSPDRPTVLIGPNGAGKSTLLRLLAGQLRPSAGRITARPVLGFAAQTPVALPSFSVERQIGYAAWLAGVRRSGIAESAERAMALTRIVDLAGQSATRLSGGQLARLNIACALAARPQFVLLDEPNASLDPISRQSVLEVLSDLRDNGVGVLATSHAATDIRAPFARVLVMDRGRVVYDGEPSHFLHDRSHRHPVVAELAQALNER